MKKGSVKLILIVVVFAAVIAGVIWNVESVRNKVSDYWEEQSSEYTAFKKELTAGTILEKTEYVESISEDKYAYQYLNEEEKQVYDEVLNAILNHTDKITVATLDEAVLKRAFENMSSDYGGLFWVSGYSYTEYTRNEEVVSIEFAPKYILSYEERLQTQEQIDLAVEEFLQGISLTDSDYDKAIYVFEKLIQEVDYDKTSSNNQNIISVFLDKQTVCQGYASATLYLLNQLNIPSVIVTGTANGEAHAWNLIQLDGEYYYMDTTWGNSSYLNEDSVESKFVNYSYFTFTTEEMLATHQPDKHIGLPDCTSIVNDYFVHEGLYFTEWLPDEIGDLYGMADVDEVERVSIKFANKELFEKAKNYFIEQQRLEDYVEIQGNVYYLEDVAQLILTISIK